MHFWQIQDCKDNLCGSWCCAGCWCEGRQGRCYSGRWVLQDERGQYLCDRRCDRQTSAHTCSNHGSYGFHCNCVWRQAHEANLRKGSNAGKPCSTSLSKCSADVTCIPLKIVYLRTIIVLHTKELLSLRPWNYLVARRRHVEDASF